QTKLGFPEVQLGLIPGFGGCIRLPKLIGLRNALKLILAGKNIRAKQAYTMGLVDEQVPSLVLEKRALELAQQIINDKAPSHPKNSYKDKNNPSYWLEILLKPVICFIFKKQILKKTKGFYPAPLKAISLLRNTYHFPVSHRALQKEALAFIKLFHTKEAKNLIRLWTTIDQAKKITLSSKSHKSIERVAVIGAGVMGQSISYLLVDKGFKVRLIDSQSKALCSALSQTKKLLEKQKKRGQINSYELEDKINNLSVSQNLWGFKTFDLVIEALPEDLKLKQKLISEISKKVSSECLFASNSSSLSILELAKSSFNPSLFFGLHFFNPAYKMPLLEVCLTESQKESLSPVFPFIKRINKIPLLVKDSPGFIVNRILVSYLTECLNLLAQGYHIQHIDSIFREQLGMPLGPFELMDKIGLDICLNTISHLQQKGIFFKTPEWTKNLTQTLGQGEKSKKGFYIYKNKQKVLNQKTATLKRKERGDFITDKQIIQRVIDKVFAEGHKLIQNNIVQQEEEIDLAMILGTGFPAFLGGPMRYKIKR
ncbi:MAG: 3-hydroxyacyl-CoA dehydrogenase NAD-binding domain-containing protein, partial [Oligoflexia bacterium]|nr:3-hydroxyacyl-CoA dehydrogenase NAD-binding domain-containing protein [Oligoflexia bacterium]